jgi:CYTH domain-containing protein/predicted ATPase
MPYNESMAKVTEIVLTGGPCAGKSSALTYLATHLSEHGVRVLQVPEVATLFISGGLNDITDIAQAEPEKFIKLEHSMIKMQGDFRRRFLEIAEQFETPTIILYDRAQTDVIAYIGEMQFNEIRSHLGLSLADVRDSYSAVIFLRTAADGAEQAYTTANNAARSETPEQARDIDKRTLQAWVGHPHLWIVENEADFQSKLERTLEIALHAAGIPTHHEVERKYLLKSRPHHDDLIARGARVINMEQVYLMSPPGSVNRIRRRTQNGTESTYTYTSKSRARGIARDEEEFIISESEYQTLSRMADPECAPIRKFRYHVPYKGQMLEIDFFFDSKLTVFEIELTDAEKQVVLPDFLDIDREVTNEPGWGNYDLARALKEAVQEAPSVGRL